MEEIWIISRLVVYSHLFYHNFLTPIFFRNRLQEISHHEKQCRLWLWSCRLLRSWIFLKGPTVTAADKPRWHSAVKPVGVSGRFVEWKEAQPLLFWLEDDTSPTKPPWIFFLEKKHRVVQQFWVVKKGFVPKTHSNLQPPPKKPKNDEFITLNMQQTFFKVKTNILKHFLCKKSCRVFFF